MALLWIDKAAETDTAVTLRLEGEIAGDSIAVLLGECQRWLPRHTVRVDLARVTYISPGGIRALHRLSRGPVELLNGSPLIRGLLERGGADESARLRQRE